MSGYIRPFSQAEALSLLDENTLIVAGATDIFPARTSGLAWGRTESQRWLDISGLRNLRTIQEPDQKPGEGAQQGWRIGALVTWSDLVDATLPSCFDGLVAAAREVGGAQIQNRATLVGNVCNASPAADGVPPLLCLDASVEISSADYTRTAPLKQFIKGNRQIALAPNEMVTAICVPSTFADARGYFLKLGARKYLVISIVMISALVCVDSTGVITDIRIAIGSCSAVAQRMGELESALCGCSIHEVLADRIQAKHFSTLSPIDDIRSDATYRRAAAVELVNKLLLDVQAVARAVI